MVIRENGLVLTIGYLITEAEEVWLTTHDGRVVPAHALAYDQETGFGLVQALEPARPAGAGAWRRRPNAKLGDPVVLADGIGRSIEATIVAKQEFAGYWEYLLDEAIFIAPAHPSWGGAALIDSDGKLLGIGSLRLQMSRSGESRRHQHGRADRPAAADPRRPADPRTGQQAAAPVARASSRPRATARSW